MLVHSYCKVFRQTEDWDIVGKKRVKGNKAANQNSLKHPPKKQSGDDKHPRLMLRRSVFILPMCQNRHTSTSLGQFLF